MKVMKTVILHIPYALSLTQGTPSEVRSTARWKVSFFLTTMDKSLEKINQKAFNDSSERSCIESLFSCQHSWCRRLSNRSDVNRCQARIRRPSEPKELYGNRKDGTVELVARERGRERERGEKRFCSWCSSLLPKLESSHPPGKLKSDGKNCGKI